MAEQSQPQAIQEEVVVPAPETTTPMERLQAGLASIPEGQIYSQEVQETIDRFNGLTSLAEGMELFRQNGGGDRFYEMLYHRPENEGRKVTQFLSNLNRIPTLPSPDVDFI